MKINKPIIIIITTILISIAIFSVTTYASTNTKADAAYDKLVNRLKESYRVTRYKYTDITGDGIHEAIIFGKQITDSGTEWRMVR